LDAENYVDAVSNFRPPPSSSSDYVQTNLARTFPSSGSGYSELRSNNIAPSSSNVLSSSLVSSSSSISASVPVVTQKLSGSNLAGSTWNSEFQQLQEIRDDSPERYAALSALAHDFFATAQHYAAIIVSEFHLQDYQRTIRQCTTIGGTAGGLKFVASGILFKFAHDPLLSSDRHLYSGSSVPDTESAAKGLGHELKGAAGYYWSNVDGLSLPLMALIDVSLFACFVLFVQSLLLFLSEVFGFSRFGCFSASHFKSDFEVWV